MRVRVKRSFERTLFMPFLLLFISEWQWGEITVMWPVLTSPPSPIRIGRNLHRNLEIPLVAWTEFGSDLDLTLRFSDHYRNVLHTTYNDCRWGTIYCRKISDNQNKHYIVDNVAGVNQCTACVRRLLVAATLDKTGKRLWSLDSVFCPSPVSVGRGPVADRPSIVSLVGVPVVANPSDWVSVYVIEKKIGN